MFNFSSIEIISEIKCQVIRVRPTNNCEPEVTKE